MKTFYKCEFGSKIYGTSIPTSDSDYKGVFLPSDREIVLQKVPKVITNNTKIDDTKRNVSTDVDSEMFSLQQYMKLLLEGQTPALDMLFCPREFVLERANGWDNLIYDNRSAWLHKGTSQFVGYVQQQGQKYGLKGFRIAAIREALDLFKGLSDHNKTLNSYQPEMEILYKSNPKYIQVWLNHLSQPHIEVANKKIPYNCKVSLAVKMLQESFDMYGHRAMLAEKNEGIDWKALYHSVRVARQAEELLLTGHITLPRPEKDLLLQIRKGNLPYTEVAELIEEGLVRVEAAKAKSDLPEIPNYALAEELITVVHYKIVKDGEW